MVATGILEKIVKAQKEEIAAAKAARPDAELRAMLADAPPVRDFFAALAAEGPIKLIAEVKKASPSAGVIRADFDPVSCAKAYFEGGAAAISVLTDARDFGGRLEYLDLVRRAVPLPLLRKDFVVDPYQIDEARVAGADAVLLIAAAFPGASSAAQLRPLMERAAALALDALVEVHDERELAVALECGSDLVGINNRDLASFEIDLGVSERLARQVPEAVVIVAESGIFTAHDVARLEAAGADACLVGEALMREPDLALALRELRRESQS
ncbi:MAG TPA: indole-3-glycerol phosphate synthase TrpC [Myxococcota bacterium]|nr:indole-3-glycerol phosphate synthase TrpC [Myxococcota bacterium]